MYNGLIYSAERKVLIMEIEKTEKSAKKGKSQIRRFLYFSQTPNEIHHHYHSLPITGLKQVTPRYIY
jgi:hypothetical protein